MGIEIDKAAGKVWTQELDSGRYSQCSGHLKAAEGGYCCLGIFATAMGATEVAVMDDNDEFDEDHPDEGVPEEIISRYDFDMNGEGINSDDLLDQEWADQFDISAEHQSFFSALNDGSNFMVHYSINPFYPVMRALLNDPTTYHGVETSTGFNGVVNPGHIDMIAKGGMLSIHFRKHSFFEISQIIKVWFL